MSLFFPAFLDDAEEETDDTEETAQPKEYGIDFTTGQLTGEIVEGLEALKVWIWFALQTPRYRHYVYTWDYGCELEDLVGQAYSEEFLEAEALYMVEDCLLVNENITGISDFSVQLENGVPVLSFVADTAYGSVEFNNLAVM